MFVENLESLPKEFFTFAEKVKGFLFSEPKELEELKIPRQVKRKVLEAKKGIVFWFEDFLFVCDELIAVILKKHLNEEPENLSFLFASFFSKFMKEVRSDVVVVIALESEDSAFKYVYDGFGAIELLVKSFFYPKNEGQVSLRAFGKVLKKLGEKKLSLLWHYDEVREVYEKEIKEITV